MNVDCIRTYSVVMAICTHPQISFHRIFRQCDVISERRTPPVQSADHSSRLLQYLDLGRCSLIYNLSSCVLYLNGFHKVSTRLRTNYVFGARPIHFHPVGHLAQFQLRGIGDNYPCRPCLPEIPLTLRQSLLYAKPEIVQQL